MVPFRTFSQPTYDIVFKLDKTCLGFWQFAKNYIFPQNFKIKKNSLKYLKKKEISQNITKR